MEEMTLDDIDLLLSGEDTSSQDTVDPISSVIEKDELSLDDIDELFTTKKSSTTTNTKRPQTRKNIIQTQLPKNPYITYIRHGVSLRCACGAGASYLYKGTPICQFHAVMMLAHDINALTKHGTDFPDESEIEVEELI